MHKTINSDNMERSTSDEQQALLEGEGRTDERKLVTNLKQQQQQQHVKMNGEDTHLVSESNQSNQSMDETISVGKFQVAGGAVIDGDTEPLTPSPGGGSPRRTYISQEALDNNILLPEMEILIFLRDQTKLHVKMDGGQHATAQDLIEVVLMEQKLPEDARNMFCLWLVSPLLELRLKAHHKPFYLVQQWGDLCDKYTEEDLDDIAKDEPMLMFQRDVFFSRQLESKVKDRDALLYLYQEAKFNVLEGRYVVSVQDYYHLAGLSALIHLGHYDSRSHIAPFYRSSLEQFFPDFMLKSKKWSLSGLWNRSSDDELHTQLEQYHRRYSDRHHDHEINPLLPELYREYLQILYTYTFYGGAFFSGDIDKTTRLQFLKGFQDKPVWVSINTEGVTVVDREKNEVLLALPFETFSWRYKEAKNIDDPPILYLQFVCSESQRDTKLLVIDSYQAKLMDALIETCVNMKLEKYNSPSDSVDAPLPSPSSSSSDDPFKKCTNKLDRLCLETLTPEGDRVV